MFKKEKGFFKKNEKEVALIGSVVIACSIGGKAEAKPDVQGASSEQTISTPLSAEIQKKEKEIQEGSDLSKAFDELTESELREEGVAGDIDEEMKTAKHELPLLWDLYDTTGPSRYPQINIDALQGQATCYLAIPNQSTLKRIGITEEDLVTNFFSAQKESEENRGVSMKRVENERDANIICSFLESRYDEAGATSSVIATDISTDVGVISQIKKGFVEIPIYDPKTIPIFWPENLKREASFLTMRRKINHEFGHVLGLGHSLVKGDIINKYSELNAHSVPIDQKNERKGVVEVINEFNPAYKYELTTTANIYTSKSNTLIRFLKALVKSKRFKK